MHDMLGLANGYNLLLSMVLRNWNMYFIIYLLHMISSLTENTHICIFINAKLCIFIYCCMHHRVLYVLFVSRTILASH
jgi:hypothetical protein